MTRAVVRWSLTVVLLALTPALGAGAELIQDPAELQSKLRTVKDSRQLQLFLVEQQILAGSTDDDPGDEWSRACAGGAAYDLFKANVVGTGEKDAIVQIRLGQRFFALVAFEAAGAGWRRIPGALLISDGLYNQACLPTGCRGYFCFEFANLRTASEAAIVGRTCDVTGGGLAGEVEAMTIWQVTSAGFKEAGKGIVRESVHGRDGAASHQSEHVFEGAFPKKLVLRSKANVTPQRPPVTVSLEFAK